jgi:hypothetical protein
MPLTKVDRLTTTTGNTFANLAEWIAEHGNCGTASPTVESATLVIEEGGATALRTLNFTDGTDITAFKEEVATQGLVGESKKYTHVNISKSDLG